MSNELRHNTVGTSLTQAEFEDVALHIFNSQATGDIMYASSATQLTRLGIGATNTVLVVSGGIPSWSATLAGLTLTAPAINGTVTTTGLTMPAFITGAITPSGVDTIDIGSATAELKSIYLGDIGRIYFGLGQTLSVFRTSANMLAIEATNNGALGAPVGSGLTIGSAGNYTETQLVLVPTTGTLPDTGALNELILYRTTDTTVNFERLNFSSIAADNPQYRFGMEKGGTGVFRDLDFARENLAGKEVFLSMEASTAADSVPVALQYGHLRFDTAAMLGVASTYYIAQGTNTLTVNVPTSKSIIFTSNASTLITIAAAGITLGTGQDIIYSATNRGLYAHGADDAYLVGYARDNGVGWVEVWRMTGAADPYFSMGGSQQFKFYNSGVADFGSGAVSNLKLGTALNANTMDIDSVENLGIGVASNSVYKILAYGVTPRIGVQDSSGTSDIWDMRSTAATQSLDFVNNTSGYGSIISLNRAGWMEINNTVDPASTVDKVLIGGYDISVGNRTLALGTETAVAADADETKFSNKLPVRINGATYYIMLTVT